MEYSIEAFGDCIEELKPLLELHWEEIAVNKEKIKLNPNYDQYQALEDAGSLHMVVARDKGKVVGYFISFIVPHMHYQDHLWAMNDILFLHPDYRGGRTAMKLFAYAEADLKRLNVSVIQLHMKTEFPFEPLAQACGYKLVEYGYSKYIGA